MSEQAMPAPAGQPGTVYTFYSYKGGVGRSMALVNVGVIMASEGLRVLLVDWDLEAPGLEVFFRKSAHLEGDPVKLPGVVDLLEARADTRHLPWQECLLRVEFIGHSLDLITAGSRSNDYKRRVQQLNWDTLFREHHIGNYIDELRGAWREAYDVVLIDSRTGITDIGDICTVLLPDVLVLLFITNYQNVEGIKSMMERAVRVRSKLPIQRSKLMGVPVPARDERDRESDKFQEWQGIFATEFADLYREWLPKEVAPSEALLRLYIPYIAAWSFGETIPVLESPRERTDPSSISAAYARLAILLAARLDWAALDAKASLGDLANARIEASASRAAAQQAVEVQAQLETKLRASEEALKASATMSRRRIVLATLGGAALTAGGLYAFFNRKPSIESLIGQLDAVDAGQRAAAIELIWIRGDELSAVQREQVTKKFTALTQDPDSIVRFSAWLGMHYFDTTDRLAASAATALKDPVSWVRVGALRHLGSIKPPAKDYASAVAGMLGDSDSSVRKAAIETLLGLGNDAAQPYVGAIKRLTTDDNPAVRKAASEALLRLRAASAASAPIAKP